LRQTARVAISKQPLKIFGDHDENTIAQMKNCMAVGNVVAGVICADGLATPAGRRRDRLRKCKSAFRAWVSTSGAETWPRGSIRHTAIEDNVGSIIKDVSRIISFGVGRTNDERVEHELFDDGDAWKESDMEAYRQKLARSLALSGRAITTSI
jgi:tRNA-splicing ligase RtcB